MRRQEYCTVYCGERNICKNGIKKILWRKEYKKGKIRNIAEREIEEGENKKYCRGKIRNVAERGIEEGENKKYCRGKIRNVAERVT